jgi:hypothetical protein
MSDGRRHTIDQPTAIDSRAQVQPASPHAMLAAEVLTRLQVTSVDGLSDDAVGSDRT